MKPLYALALAFGGGIAGVYVVGRCSSYPKKLDLHCDNGDLCPTDDYKEPPQIKTKYENITVSKEPEVGNARYFLTCPEDDTDCKENKDANAYRASLDQYMIASYKSFIVTEAQKKGSTSITPELMKDLRKQALSQIGPQILSSLKGFTPNEAVDNEYKKLKPSCQAWFGVADCCEKLEEGVDVDPDCQEHVTKTLVWKLAEITKKRIETDPAKFDPKIEQKTIGKPITSIVTKTDGLTFRVTYTGTEEPKETVILLRDLDMPPEWDKSSREALAKQYRVIEVKIPMNGDWKNIFPTELGETIVNALMKSKQLNPDPKYNKQDSPEAIKRLNAPVTGPFVIVVQGDKELNLKVTKRPGYGLTLAKAICVHAAQAKVPHLGTLLIPTERPALGTYLAKAALINEEAWIIRLGDRFWGGEQIVLGNTGHKSYMGLGFILSLASAIKEGDKYPKRLEDLEMTPVEVAGLAELFEAVQKQFDLAKDN